LLGHDLQARQRIVEQAGGAARRDPGRLHLRQQAALRESAQHEDERLVPAGERAHALDPHHPRAAAQGQRGSRPRIGHRAKRRLVQLVLLDHRAHRAVNDDDALAQQALQMFNSVRHRFQANLLPEN